MAAVVATEPSPYAIHSKPKSEMLNANMILGISVHDLLHAELFSLDQLDAHGESLARKHDLDLGKGKDRLLSRLDENERSLEQTYEVLSQKDNANIRLTPAGAWLLDNFYLIQEQIETARSHLPKKYSQNLPRLSTGLHTGLPRIYSIIQDLISRVDGRVEEANLKAILVSYQRVSTLKLGELWAVPIMLRLGLIENLRRVGASVEACAQDRRNASSWADRMLHTVKTNAKNLILDLADLSRSEIPLSTTFVTELVRRLQGQNPNLNMPLTWIEQRLVEQGRTIERQIQMESQLQAIQQISVSNSIGSLRFLSAHNWKDFVESLSVVEQILRSDPAGIHGNMNFATRDRYRHVVERISKHSPYTEEEVAQKVIERCRLKIEMKETHVGFALIDKGLPALERALTMRRSFRDLLRAWCSKMPLACYLFPMALITFGLTFVSMLWIAPLSLPWMIGLSALFILIYSQLALPLVNWLTTLVVAPKLLPRMDFTAGIPSHACTLVTVPTLLSSQSGIEDLLSKIEICYLSDRTENLYFSLLTDFKDAESEQMPEDTAMLEQVQQGIQKLNRQYGGTGLQPFYLFHRPRIWNPTEKIWMGYERKRGKLEELNDALRSPTPSKIMLEGNHAVLATIRYVITLDTDTLLPREVARHLIETMAHPLNIAVYDTKKKRVVEGYTILQPRVVSSLTVAKRTWYARIFGSNSGIDPYTLAISDVYQDVFGEGSFIGKGIYDVDMFAHVLGKRLPENRILSHDLLEGTYSRCGFVSDLQFVDVFPSKYSEDVARRHRWIRGDWQNIPWLSRSVPSFQSIRTANPITILSQFKLLDNLRRSLVAPAMLMLILLNWFFYAPAWLGMLVCIIILWTPTIPDMVLSLWNRPKHYPISLHIKHWIESTTLSGFQALFTFMVIPFEALSNLDAIGRTLWRMFLSHRNLLEWTATGEVKLLRINQRSGKSTTWLGFQQSMWIAPGIAILLYAVYWNKGLSLFVPALGFLVLWFIAPTVAWFLSTPFAAKKPSFTQKDIFYLRRISRKTWRFFENFVGAEDNWLPPDNYQESPTERIAHRTSPTNIGILLLSNLGAFDQGYLTAGQLIDRCRKTLKTMENMAKFRGHFFNWYDTRTLEPLHPHYVSTVDSGNLMGFLLTLGQGLQGVVEHKIFQKNIVRGMIDTLLVLSERSTNINEFSKKIKALDSYDFDSATLSDTTNLLTILLQNTRDWLAAKQYQNELEIDWWLHALEAQILAIQEEMNYLTPWVTSQEEMKALRPDIKALLLENRALPQFASLLEILPEIESESLAYLVRQGVHRAGERISLLEQLSLQCKQLADQDFDFLYDKLRRLLTIGYDVGKQRRDESFYDILATEARLASFIGIAQGKIPVEHWFSMGRHVTIHKGKMVLISWGGSMFEYLMPRLLLPSFDNTLLDQSQQGAVEKQITYGEEQGVPWGISESGFNLTDAYLNYQYRSFGVPGLGFKNDLAQNLVTAPYATMLALMIRPVEACSNLQRMTDLGYEGRFGFYEAVDHTISRQAPQQDDSIVRSFMVHHQGMGFLSFVNFFHSDIMLRRFESNKIVASALHLLQERVPHSKPFQFQDSEAERIPTEAESQENLLRIFTTANTPFPEVHLLSNGRYHVMLTNSGGGYSKWRDIMVTRWRSDTTLDSFGTFFYVRDLTRGKNWSATFQPARVDSKNYEAIFPQARAEFRRRDDSIETYTEIAVLPEDDIEHRRITLGNFSKETREIELTSYAEVILLPLASDASHPAFSNLFMETELFPQENAILCSRRPRAPSEENPWMIHLLAVESIHSAEISFETDRLQFIGRGRTIANPHAMDGGVALSNSCGAVLDPIVAIRCKVVLAPGESITVSFITGIAETRAKVMALMTHYQDRSHADRVFDLARIHGSVILQQINATESDAQVYGKLASSILYPSSYRRSAPSILMKNRRGQSSLWAYAISGDLPIILLRISDISNISLATKLIQAHAFWRIKGLQVDLVIWNEDWSGYRQELNDKINSLISMSKATPLFEKAGGIFVRHAEMISEEDCVLMQSCASVVITDTEGSLYDQVQSYTRPEPRIPLLKVFKPAEVIASKQNFEQDNLAFFNGWGGFSQDGREYIIHIKPDSPPPMPWVNVIANKHFGTVVSQSGGYSWAENAHEFRLTPWYNDPVTDASGELYYIRNEATGKFWSATPLPCPANSDYLQRQGFGYSVFECHEDGLKTELWVYVDSDAAVKFWFLKARNDSTQPKRFSATLFLELVLGESRSKTQMHTRTFIDPKTGAVFAANPFNTEFPGRVMFLESSEALRSVTGDRTEFLGRNGTSADPEALHRVHLSGRVGAGLDPCTAMQIPFELEPGQEKDVVFIMGCGRNLADARELVYRYRGVTSAYQARDRVWEFWNRTLGAINVQTPDPAFDMLANGWLLYQTMASRFMARSGFYQSGGAFGFRDQLQDVMAFLHSKPEMIREHLLLCASRQFSEGDVQHWWHPPHGRGVRTRISDDYLWLPLVTCMYVEKIGDTGILTQDIHYLEGRLVNSGEESYYDLPMRSEMSGTLYDHCKRAVQNGMRFGSHGLPLMGSGDWNDGMNLVGSAGKGESVWLGFFFSHVLGRFAELARSQGDLEFGLICDTERLQLGKNLEEYAWDGEWYRRAFFDDGQALGSAQNEECKIDSIAQSWSVLSGASTPEHRAKAMQSLDKYLVKRDLGIISLLDPPFDKSEQEPGYIKGYVPGVRENGGQYTHAAVWAAMAFAQQGDKVKANELLSMINPIHHGSTFAEIQRYKVEPYVMAADVYGVEPHAGRGGWTWYTGSSSWMYRLMIETILGLDLRVNKLYLHPCQSADWKEFQVHYRHHETLYHLHFTQGNSVNALRIVLDGSEQEGGFLPLVDDHVVHHVEIYIGSFGTKQ